MRSCYKEEELMVIVGKFYVMPEACVVFGFNNTADVKKGIGVIY